MKQFEDFHKPNSVDIALNNWFSKVVLSAVMHGSIWFVLVKMMEWASKDNLLATVALFLVALLTTMGAFLAWLVSIEYTEGLCVTPNSVNAARAYKNYLSTFSPKELEKALKEYKDVMSAFTVRCINAERMRQAAVKAEKDSLDKRKEFSQFAGR